MKLWVVGRVLDMDYWEFIGVFDDEQLAVNACFDTLCFVGPCILNENVGRETIEWPDSYYPRKDNL
jgi:hypothetical protein